MEFENNFILKFATLNDDEWIEWSKNLINNGYLNKDNLSVYKEIWNHYSKLDYNEKQKNKFLIKKLFELLNFRKNIKINENIFDKEYLINKANQLKKNNKLKKYSLNTQQFKDIIYNKIEINNININNINLSLNKSKSNNYNKLKEEKIIDTTSKEISNNFKSKKKTVKKKIPKKKVLNKTTNKNNSNNNVNNKLKNFKLNSNKNYFDLLDNTKDSLREGLNDGLMELGKLNKNVVVLSADLCSSLKADNFKKKYPKKFFEFGIAEQNMMSAAAGMTVNDKIPFVLSYAVFNPGRNWEQLRVSVCYQNANVKIIGGHAGLTTGFDGATHQALEDIAITTCLPNLCVISPCDKEETKKAIISASKHKSPCYIRISREKSLNITNINTFFKLGKANVLDLGNDLTIISYGVCLQFAIQARKELFEKYNIKATVINMHTIKPLDKDTVLKYAKITNAIVVIEEHQKTGGLGSIISHFLSESYPCKLKTIAVNDSFGESGNGYDLLTKYNISKEEIIKQSLKLFKTKTKYL